MYKFSAIDTFLSNINKTKDVVQKYAQSFNQESFREKGIEISESIYEIENKLLNLTEGAIDETGNVLINIDELKKIQNYSYEVFTEIYNYYMQSDPSMLSNFKKVYSVDLEELARFPEKIDNLISSSQPVDGQTISINFDSFQDFIYNNLYPQKSIGDFTIPEQFIGQEGVYEFSKEISSSENFINNIIMRFYEVSEIEETEEYTNNSEKNQAINERVKSLASMFGYENFDSNTDEGKRFLFAIKQMYEASKSLGSSIYTNEILEGEEVVPVNFLDYSKFVNTLFAILKGESPTGEKIGQTSKIKQNFERNFFDIGVLKESQEGILQNEVMRMSSSVDMLVRKLQRLSDIIEKSYYESVTPIERRIERSNLSKDKKSYMINFSLPAKDLFEKIKTLSDASQEKFRVFMGEDPKHSENPTKYYDWNPLNFTKQDFVPAAKQVFSEIVDFYKSVTSPEKEVSQGVSDKYQSDFDFVLSNVKDPGGFLNKFKQLGEILGRVQESSSNLGEEAYLESMPEILDAFGRLFGSENEPSAFPYITPSSKTGIPKNIFLDDKIVDKVKTGVKYLNTLSNNIGLIFKEFNFDPEENYMVTNEKNEAHLYNSLTNFTKVVEKVIQPVYNAVFTGALPTEDEPEEDVNRKMYVFTLFDEIVQHLGVIKDIIPNKREGVE